MRWFLTLLCLSLALACNDAKDENGAKPPPEVKPTKPPPRTLKPRPGSAKPPKAAPNNTRPDGGTTPATKPPPTTKPTTAKPKKSPRVVFETNKGKIIVELYARKTPKTVANFLAYVDEGFYDGTVFHRIMENFMIQGGGFTVDGIRKRPRGPIDNEAQKAGLSNLRGTIAMARTGQPHSATCQFFINVKNNNASLDPNVNPRNPHGYCVFGRVVTGMDVVDKIRQTPVQRSPSGEMSSPRESIIINKVRRVP